MNLLNLRANLNTSDGPEHKFQILQGFYSQNGGKKFYKLSIKDYNLKSYLRADTFFRSQMQNMINGQVLETFDEEGNMDKYFIGGLIYLKEDQVNRISAAKVLDFQCIDLMVKDSENELLGCLQQIMRLSEVEF